MIEQSENAKRSAWLVGLGTLIALLITALAWQIARFWHRLLRQPLLTPLIISSDETVALIDRASHIVGSNVTGTVN